MPASKAQLSAAVLEQMNVTAGGETPSAEDAALVEARYDRKLKEWRERGYVFWPNGTNRDTQEIPDVVYQTIIDLMENEVAHSFGRPNPVLERQAIEEQLLKRLRRYLAMSPSGEATPFSSY